MATDPLTERMTRIRRDAGARLDRLSEAIPPARYDRTPPFEQYMARAQATAARDPQFAERLDRAMRQYQAAQQLGGTQHGI